MTMTNIELLTHIKSGLMITGNAFDDALLLHANEVKEYLLNAGVPSTVVDSDKSIGIITRGVADLWTNDSPSLSSYFHERVSQMVISYGGDHDV